MYSNLKFWTGIYKLEKNVQFFFLDLGVAYFFNFISLIWF